MGRNIKVEICVDSLESVETIQRISEEFAHRVPWRIELCSNLISGGGLTPSMGLLRACKAAVPGLEIMVMIRPRVGPFVYSEAEVNTMEWDIDVFGSEGVDGFVFGCLNTDGTVDLMALSKLWCAAARCQSPPITTFHRAFDLTPDWQMAYTLIAGRYPFRRILTSGQAGNVTDGLGNLQEMIKKAPTLVEDEIKANILPGSGISAEMLPAFLEQLPDIDEIHLSASEAIMSFTGPVVDRGAELGFGDGRLWNLNEDKLRRVFQILSDLQDT